MVNDFDDEKCYSYCHVARGAPRNDYYLKATWYEQEYTFNQPLDTRFRGVRFLDKTARSLISGRSAA